MADHLKPDTPDLDQQLANFTDEVLSDAQLETQAMMAQNQELRALQEIVLRLKRAFGTRQPDEAMANRVRSNLIAAWRQQQSDPQRDAWWQRWYRRIAGGQTGRVWRPIYALAVVIVVILATTLLFPASPAPGGGLPGAAGGLAGFIPALLILGVVLVVVYIWLTRRK